MGISDKPCLDCVERSIGCHGRCFAYNIWKDVLAKRNQKVKKEGLQTVWETAEEVMNWWIRE